MLRFVTSGVLSCFLLFHSLFGHYSLSFSFKGPLAFVFSIVFISLQKNLPFQRNQIVSSWPSIRFNFLHKGFLFLCFLKINEKNNRKKL